MSIRLGYACINSTLGSSSLTCRLANATPERVIDLGRANLRSLAQILRWNQQHGIQVFRISSGLIPMASHPSNTAPWQAALAEEFAGVGALIAESGARVSMHPGQYTVLNSPRPEVVQASIAELAYHAQVLNALGTDASAKLVLHLGGVYGDREAAMARFAENFARLPESVQKRLVLENDEKSYSLADALDLSEMLRGQGVNVPVVFDVFHHTWNPSFPGEALRGLIERAAATWSAVDGRQKIHYSEPWPGKPAGSHSQSVDPDVFGPFYEQVHDLPLDVMLEVKDKEQSVLALYRRFPELAAASLGQVRIDHPRLETEN